MKTGDINAYLFKLTEKEGFTESPSNPLLEKNLARCYCAPDGRNLNCKHSSEVLPSTLQIIIAQGCGPAFLSPFGKASVTSTQQKEGAEQCLVLPLSPRPGIIPDLPRFLFPCRSG